MPRVSRFGWCVPPRSIPHEEGRDVVLLARALTYQTKLMQKDELIYATTITPMFDPG